MQPTVPGSLLIRPLLPFVSRLTERYIARERERLHPDAEPLGSRSREEFRAFFPREVLEETRIVRASVPNPRFYSLVKWLGIKGVLEMSSIGAITLIDVVASPDRISPRTLFHELVHVVQYRVLGLRSFATLYVAGFLNGGGYERIPLERQAYELAERFSRNPAQAFSVEDDVIQRLRAKRL